MGKLVYKGFTDDNKLYIGRTVGGADVSRLVQSKYERGLKNVGVLSEHRTDAEALAAEAGAIALARALGIPLLNRVNGTGGRVSRRGRSALGYFEDLGGEPLLLDRPVISVAGGRLEPAVSAEDYRIVGCRAWNVLEGEELNAAIEASKVQPLLLVHARDAIVASANQLLGLVPHPNGGWVFRVGRDQCTYLHHRVALADGIILQPQQGIRYFASDGIGRAAFLEALR